MIFKAKAETPTTYTPCLATNTSTCKWLFSYCIPSHHDDVSFFMNDDEHHQHPSPHHTSWLTPSYPFSFSFSAFLLINLYLCCYRWTTCNMFCFYELQLSFIINPPSPICFFHFFKLYFPFSYQYLSYPRLTTPFCAFLFGVCSTFDRPTPSPRKK